MMPLTLATVGEENIIKRIGGLPEVRQHLENLGFVVGGTVTVITTLGGNVIVNVKGSQNCHQQGNGSEDHDLR